MKTPMPNPTTTASTGAQHTPGPWRYEASTRTIRSVPANYWLATMDSWDGAVNHEANAALIASAPTLAAERDRLKAVLEKTQADVAKLIRNFNGPMHSDEGIDLAVMETRIREALTGTGPSPYDALKQERDELLASLEEMVIANHGLPIRPHEEKDPVCAKALERARAAIRKAQGGAGA